MKHAQDGDKAVTHLDHAWIGGPFIADGMLHPEDKQAIREMGFEEIRFDRCQPSYIITVEEV